MLEYKQKNLSSKEAIPCESYLYATATPITETIA